MPRSTGAPVHFDRVTLIGLGLVGSSLGWVLKKRHLATEIVGHDAKPAVRAKALELGFIDRAEARRLITKGQAAVSSGDGEGLRNVVRALWELQPKGGAEATRERAVRSGLRKF